MKTPPRWGSKVCLLIGSVFASLLVAEILLRWTGYEYRPLKIEFGAIDDRYFHIFENRHFVYDPELLWRPRPSFEFFNAQGFSGPELDLAKPGGEFRIFALGDSNTLGFPETNWPEDLQEILSQSCDGFQVVNAGVWGYTSDQGLRRLEEVRKFQPDMVLISFGANDAHPTTVPDKQYTARSMWSRRLEGLIHSSRVARLATGVLTHLTVLRTGEMIHRVSLEDYSSNLEEMAKRVLSDGAVPVLLTRPYHGKMPRVTKWKSFGHAYNAMTAEVAERLDLPLVDLYTHFRERDELFVDDSHFNPEGHRLAAQIVYERIQPFLRGDGFDPCPHTSERRMRPDDSN